MRLLNVRTLDFEDFQDASVPKYVAASHRWVAGETTFQDVRDGRNAHCSGYQKILAFANYVQDNLPGDMEWLWIDTCCINKESASELSEAINSMFKWYRDAELCLAYMADVEAAENLDSFRLSDWFDRGWTLQELLAPRKVLFMTKDWEVIGHKGDFTSSNYESLAGKSLEATIAQITRIPEKFLHSYEASDSVSVDEKLQWIEGRKTTREEDMSYALYGILDVALGANYGEGYKRANDRLMVALYQRKQLAAQKAEEYKGIMNWLSPSDPWTNHETARQRHECGTGAWLLQHDSYQAWKAGRTRLLWVYGKAGCGKTVLCSTAIEDIKAHCQGSTNIGHAIFYFSFSDTRKQSYRDHLLSLVVQLGKKEPGLSMLHSAHQNPDRKPMTKELQDILLACIASYDQVYIHLDGIDECPESEDERQHVLEGVGKLLDSVQHVRLLVTSRDESDICARMNELEASLISVTEDLAVADDILKYVTTQISQSRTLCRLDDATKELVKKTLSQKADGMFRWVYCQVETLKRSKSTRPKDVKAALSALPRTLDETYERMLTNIDECDHSTALVLLRWIAYAREPPTLSELAEASIVYPGNDPTAPGVVDTENRGDCRDTLDIIAGLVIIESHRGDYGHWRHIIDRHRPGSEDIINEDSTVRLAHFSVREYLESRRILESQANQFHLDPAREHRFLTQSCLVYLIDFLDANPVTQAPELRVAPPLLSYAACEWYYHALLQTQGDATRELSLLSSEMRKRLWVDLPSAHLIDFDTHLERYEPSIGSALYYTSLLGLQAIVQDLLADGADTNAQGGSYGTALQAASAGGHEQIVKLLLGNGADVNAKGGYYGTALQAASARGQEHIVKLLLDYNADVNAQGGGFGTALIAACWNQFTSQKEMVNLLLSAGADINDPGTQEYGNALEAAAMGRQEEIADLLLANGAKWSNDSVYVDRVRKSGFFDEPPGFYRGE